MKSLKLQATLLLMALTVAFSAVLANQRPAEKRVTFYSTYGYLKDQDWIIPMRLWVYEPPDAMRIAAAKALRGSLADRAGIDELNDEQKDLFAIRAHSFVADSESGEKVVFRFDSDPLGTNYSLSGHFVLIGDSGERDPEVFATVRKQHPVQIIEIRIRDVRGDADKNPQRLQAMTVINSEDTTCENNYPH